MLRAQVGRKRDDFGDTLVSVTGAGSGIGRETALAFARSGAEVVVSDIDEASVKDTAAQIVERGGVAHPYVVDVSDAEAVERFADEVCAEHGVPDIVVNNAGIGQAGEFLNTPAEQWERVLDVNLGGVVNGCRAFGKRLVERGTGGHIVNVASMASYSPSKSLNAYCTSKAAVYMFSDCLRAELDAAGIGLTTVCPGTIDTNIVHTTRFDTPGRSDESIESRRRATAEAVQASTFRTGQGRKGDRLGGQEEQADPAHHPGGLPAVRHLSGAAAGDAQCGPRQTRIAQPFSATSSSTANIVRVGTPVPPLPV